MKRARAIVLAAFVGLPVGAASCGGASADSGVGTEMQLSGGGVQFVAGPLLDDPAAVGPAVHGVSASGQVFPGALGRTVSGSVEAGAAAVLLGIVGDTGHYIVPVSGQDIDNPPDLDFSAQAAFATTLAPGAYTILVRAVGADGAVGPGATQGLTVTATAVVGTLVISLSWDTEADLDLHVVAPTPDGNTVELWSGNRSSLPPRSPLEGGPYSDAELATAGILDFDSNAQCVIDGRLLENVFWTAPAPAGHYVVRVDTFSMCGQPAVRWNLSASLDGASLGTFAGETTDSDTRFAHGPGAGLTVTEFDVM